MVKMEFKMDIMSDINHFKKIVLCGGDVAADVYHLHVKRIHL
jgi:hypothetical protein